MKTLVSILACAAFLVLGEAGKAHGQVCPNGQCPIVREHQVQLRWQEQAFEQVPSYYAQPAIREQRSYYEPQGFSAPSFYYVPQPAFYQTYSQPAYYYAQPARPRGLFVEVGVHRFRPGR